MIYRPTKSNLALQALLISIAFALRYTAIYYPIAGLAAIAIANYRPSFKIAGIVAPWFFIIPFIIYTQQKTKEVTGTDEFSVFGGWQLANNALYMYDYIDVDSTELPPNTLELNRLAADYFQVVPPKQRILESVEGTYFIKVSNAILKPYMLDRYGFNDAPTQFVAWGKVSPIYQAFGKHLIIHHPLAFARYYLWLNAKNYFVPYLEKFGYYNTGRRTVNDAAKTWFKLKSNDIRLVPKIGSQKYIFYLFPYLFSLLNWYFLACLVYCLLFGKLKDNSKYLNSAIFLGAIFLILNFAFSVFATPVVLRYQIVPMILLVYYSIILTSCIDQPEKSEAPITRLKMPRPSL